jgi:rod shape determining protein RodA
VNDRIKHYLKDFDWFTFLLVLAVALVGIVEIRSATHRSHTDVFYLKQLYWVLFGIVCMVVVVSVDYHSIVENVPYIYLTAIVSLVVVLVLGHTVSGTRGWFSLGGHNIGQPAEFVKIAVILALSRFLAEIRTEYLPLRDIFKAGAIVGAPFLLILLQPDLGSALTVIPILAVGLYLGGLKRKWILIGFLVGTTVIGMSWFLLKPYQKERIYTFMDPQRDPLGRGYHAIQSKIAVGSGGFWGKGLGKGSQTELGFLPERHTDFIFSVIGEEMGFFGTTSLLVLYFLILIRFIHVAQTARDKLGMHIALGACGLILCHVMINIGMVVGVMPITGIPLPLLSYGGSSILATFILLGLVINVRMRRFIY